MPKIRTTFVALCLACWTHYSANAQNPTSVVQAAIYASGVQPTMVNMNEQPTVAVGKASTIEQVTSAPIRQTATGVVQAAIHASGVQPAMVTIAKQPTEATSTASTMARMNTSGVQAATSASGEQPALAQTGEQPTVAFGITGSNGVVQATSGVEATLVQTGEQSGVTDGTAAGSMDFSIASAMAVADIRRYIAQKTGNAIDTTVQVDPKDIELEQERREAEEKAAQEKTRAESLFEVQAQVQDGIKDQVEDKVDAKNDENNPSRMDTEQLFGSLDKDKDGVLSPNEFEQEARLIEDGDAVIGHLHAVFATSDKNADGKIDKSEFPGMINAFIGI